MGVGDVDCDSGVGFDGVELDLLDVGGGFGIGGALMLDFGAAGGDAGVSCVHVVEEDFLGVVTGGRDAVGDLLALCVSVV